MAKYGAAARAFALYAVLAVAIIDHGAPLTRALSGRGNDPTAFVWFLAWWPFALSHQLNPFYTNYVWQPAGLSLAWMTAVPLLGVLLMPVTWLAGPATAYNIAIIAAPALSAFAFYFLARRFGGEGPALIGGYLYGFSTYVLTQDDAVLNLSFVPIPPLLALLVWARVAGEVTRVRYVLAAAALLAAEFLLSLEITAFCLIFGGLAWALALAYFPSARPRLWRLLPETLLALALLAAVVGPVLWQMWQERGAVRLPRLWRFYFAADLANIVIPSTQNLWGGLTGWGMASRSGQEEDAYLGLPLLLMIGEMLPAARRAAGTRYLLALFAILLVASLGPILWFAGTPLRTILPWGLVGWLPVLSDALPARFALFVSLAASLLAVRFMACGGRWRLGLGVLAGLALFPRPHPWTPRPDATFFAPGHVQAALGTRPQLLILPFAINAPSSYWQVESQFAFTQTGGYLGYPPAAMQAYPAVAALFGNQAPPGFATHFAQFAIATGTQFVVLTAATTPAMTAALDTLGWPARRVDDVTILTVPHG